MSNDIEDLLLNAFSSLGTYRELETGFRLQAAKNQTCAVYFSGNLPGNVVEIGLSPTALAPIIGFSEAEIREWVRVQAAITGRERTVSGQRGIYPGIAFGSTRELKDFLESWSQFRASRSGVAAETSSLGMLESTRIEKAAGDAGFDLSPEHHGNWLVFRSSAFAPALGVSPHPGENYLVGFSDSSWGQKVAHDIDLPLMQEEGPWPARIDGVVGYESLYSLLIRSALVARVIGDAGHKEFEAVLSETPKSTEVERLVVQRVGQRIFRDSLISYWQGRCAATGLDVTPLLRASHIKPWAECENDSERLDVYNGLLLAPTIDALFDGGWVTFSTSGKLIVSQLLGLPQRNLLGLSGDMRLDGLTDAHQAYLEYHRTSCFEKPRLAAYLVAGDELL